jgi:hypothetical protein
VSPELLQRWVLADFGPTVYVFDDGFHYRRDEVIEGKEKNWKRDRYLQAGWISGGRATVVSSRSPRSTWSIRSYHEYTDWGVFRIPQLLTVDQLVRMLQLPSRETVYFWNRMGTGPTYCRVGKYLLYNNSDVLNWWILQAGGGLIDLDFPRLLHAGAESAG